MSAECSAGNIPAGYKQTEVGVIPEDWEYLTIGNSIDLLTGYPFPSVGYSKSGVRLLRGSNVKRGVTDWSEEGTEFWPAITSEIRRYALKAGDIVVAMDGSLVGRSFAMLSDSDVPAVLLQRVARIRSESIEQNFLKAWICSQRFTEHCDAVKTVTAIPHISPADIKSFKIALPPTKAEQEAIAEALSDADAFIESLEQLIVKKRQIKQGAMQELLTGKKRLPGFSGEWETKRLGSVLKFQVGFPFSSSYFNEAGQGIRLIKNRDLKCDDQIIHYSGKIDTEFLVQDGDLLVGMDGDFLPFLWVKGSALLNQRVGRIVELPGLNRVFAFYYLIEPLKEIENVTSSTTVKHLSHGDIEDIEKSLPHIEEQTAIASILSDMDSEITELEEKLAKARQIKQGMMQKLLTGRIRLV